MNPFRSADFEKHRANVPAWPTDPEARARLLQVARAIENGWNEAKETDARAIARAHERIEARP